MRTVNTLGVGPMGFGGARVAHRLQGRRRSTACPPASSSRWRTTAGRIAGWACCSTRPTGAIKKWIYRDPSVPTMPMMDQAGFQRTGREVVLRAPITEATGARAQGGRRRAARAARRSRARRRAPSPDEARAAGRPARRRDLSLRPGGGQADGRRLDGHGGGPDHQHPRRAVPGRHHRQVRRARGDGQGRDGRPRRWPGSRSTARSTSTRSAAPRSSTPGASSGWTGCRCSSSERPRRCGIYNLGTSRRSSPWTPTATACTRTWSRPRRADWLSLAEAKF